MQAINIHLLTRYDAATPGWGTVSRPSYAKPRNGMSCVLARGWRVRERRDVRGCVAARNPNRVSSRIGGTKTKSVFVELRGMALWPRTHICIAGERGHQDGSRGL
jgi:hypothetical protein